MNVARFLPAMLVTAAAMNAWGQPVDPKSSPPAAERPVQERGSGGLGADLPVERARAAWESQAAMVSRMLGLGAEKAAGVSKAYTESRAAHQKVSDTLREEIRVKREEGAAPESFREVQRKMEEAVKSEREKLRSALGAHLTPEQTTRAMGVLGTFNRQWDALTDAVLEMRLDAAKQGAAMTALQEYVSSLSGMRGEENKDAPRISLHESRAKLQEAMKAVLTQEQYAKFEATLGGGGRPGGSGGAGGGGGGK